MRIFPTYLFELCPLCRSANGSSDYLPGTSSGSNSPPLQSLKREAAVAVAGSFGGDKGLQEEYEDEEAGAKKKPRKSGPQSGQYYRRNIKDVLSEEKLQNVTKEAKVRY